MRHRPPRRAAAALGAALLLLALTGCVADTDAYPHTGERSGWTEGSVVRTVLLYLVLPVALCVLLGALATVNQLRKRNRYRPQEGWDAEPVWFAGPPDPVAAVEQATAGDAGRGGAGGRW